MSLIDGFVLWYRSAIKLFVDVSESSLIRSRRKGLCLFLVTNFFVQLATGCLLILSLPMGLWYNFRLNDPVSKDTSNDEPETINWQREGF